MSDFKKRGYKAVSAIAATLESIAKPAITHTHLLMISGQRQLFVGISGALDEANRGTAKKANRLISGLKRVVNFFHRLTVTTIRANFWESMQYVEAIERGLTSHQIELEAFFEENQIDVHKHWAFSIENRQVISEIANFVRREIGELKPIPVVRLWQYLIAWAVVQRTARKNLWTFIKDVEEPAAFRLEEMAHFCKFAVGIYGKLLTNIFMKSKFGDLFKKSEPNEILQNYAGISKGEVLYIQPDSRQFLPAHAICKDTSRHTIVVCIRGTLSVFDALTDLNGEYASYVYTDPDTGEEKASGYVHKGIMTGAIKLSEELADKTKEALEANPGYTVVIVGHSLGAGATALLTLLWLSDPYFISRGLRAYAYAPPPVFSQEFTVHVKPYLMSAVLGSDLVTRICYGTIKDLIFIIRELAEWEQRRSSIRASEIAASSIFGKKKSVSELIEVYKELMPIMVSPKLVLPGFIYQMYDTIRNFEASFFEKNRRFAGAFADPSYYSQIVFSKTLLTDHMPNFYEAALKALVFHEEPTTVD